MSRCDSKAISSWRRWLLIGGMLVLGGATLLLVPVLAQPQQFEQGWGTILNEDFGGDFPGYWIVTDTSTTDGGEYYWGTENFTYTSPITGVWCVGGGAQGSGLVAGTDTYTNNVDSWLIYGPITLSHIFDARLEFDWWLDTVPSGTELDVRELRQLHRQSGTAPASGDWFGWCATTDISDLENACLGTYVSGRSGTWVSGTMSLKSYVPASFSLTNTVWIAFHFISDDDGAAGRGAFLDNVVLRVNHGYKIALPLVRKDPTPTPTPTPTPSVYHDDFGDPGSGWPDDKWPIKDDKGNILAYRYRRYIGGQYQVLVPDPHSPWGWFKGLVALAPYSPPDDSYCVEARMKFHEYAPFGATMALIFGANESNTRFYALCLSAGAGWEEGLSWFIVRQDDYELNPSNPTVRTAPCTAEELNIEGIHNDPLTHATDWNLPRVCVNGDQATVYLSGTPRRVYDDLSGLSTMTRVGVGSGSGEHLPIDARVDYFRVEP